LSSKSTTESSPTGRDDNNIRHADQRGQILEVSIGVFSGGARHYRDAAAFDHTGHHSQPSIVQRYSCCTIRWLQVNTTGG
jgi:hypothetical protein